MKQPANAEFSPRVEGALAEQYAAGDPAPRFVAALEQRLMAQANESRGAAVARDPGRFQWRTPLAFVFQRRWLPVAVVLLLALAMAITAIGPQRVLAQIQRLLWGYAPGIGFVDLADARVLTDPVAVTRGAVTLRIEQVVAQSDGTVVSLTAEGLPPFDRQWAQDNPGIEAHLALSEGRTLELKGATSSWGEAQLRFPALPASALSTTLSLKRLPLAPAGLLPEDWRVHLPLRPAAYAPAADVFPQAYEPEGVEATQHGVTLRVLRVAHTAESTAVQVEVRWAEQSWHLGSLGYHRLPALGDDLGHVYSSPSPRSRPGSTTSSQHGAVTTVEQVVVAQPGSTAALPEPGRAERTLTFAPVSAAARRVTFAVDDIEFNGFSPYEAVASFTLDLGTDTHPGQRWQLDQWLDVGGFPVHLIGARLEQTTVQYSDGKRPAFGLKLELDPMPEREGARLESITVDPGQAGTLAYGMMSGNDRRAPEIQFAELPSGILSLKAQPQSILVSGPWQLAWDAPQPPAGQERGPAPWVLSPQNVSDTHSGLTLQLDQAVLTDRLTTLRLKIADPAGTEIQRLPGSLPDMGWLETYIADEQGRRFGTQGHVGWSPSGGLIHDPAALYLEPVSAGAGTVSLYLPSVEILVPGRTSFDVVVPPGLRVDPEARDQYGRLAATPFPVDIPLETAGYRWRINYAEVTTNGSEGRLILGPTSVDLKAGRKLAGYCMASVTSPSGHQLPHGDQSRSTADPCDFQLAFAVGDRATGAVEPGTYHVELNGIVVAVPGPWRLSWDVPSR